MSVKGEHEEMGDGRRETGDGERGRKGKLRTEDYLIPSEARTARGRQVQPHAPEEVTFPPAQRTSDVPVSNPTYPHPCLREEAPARGTVHCLCRPTGPGETQYSRHHRRRHCGYADIGVNGSKDIPTPTSIPWP